MIRTNLEGLSCPSIYTPLRAFLGVASLGVVAGLVSAIVLPISLMTALGAAALGAGLMLAPHLATAISLVEGLVAGMLDDVRHFQGLVFRLRTWNFKIHLGSGI